MLARPYVGYVVHVIHCQLKHGKYVSRDLGAYGRELKGRVAFCVVESVSARASCCRVRVPPGRWSSCDCSFGAPPYLSYQVSPTAYVTGQIMFEALPAGSKILYATRVWTSPIATTRSRNRLCRTPALFYRLVSPSRRTFPSATSSTISHMVQLLTSGQSGMKYLSFDDW